LVGGWSEDGAKKDGRKKKCCLQKKKNTLVESPQNHPWSPAALAPVLFHGRGGVCYFFPCDPNPGGRHLLSGSGLVVEQVNELKRVDELTKGLFLMHTGMKRLKT
jgi:hypothetical protein